MSGHSKWKTNKGKKAAADAKKGATYTRLIKEITIIAREGGGNPDQNSKLRTVMARAKEANMPLDNIKMAIKRGTGEVPGITYESVKYEGFGPGGVAIMIDAITDNKNRCAAEVRNIMSKTGGSLGGSVSWMFTMKGYIAIDKAGVSEDDVMTIALDAGADDIKTEGTQFEVYSAPQKMDAIKAALEAKGIKCETAEVTMVPSSTVKLDLANAKKLKDLIDALEEHDDVENVYDNSDIPDDVMAQMDAEDAG
ncbi:MAG: YebC/PmpR family DNA-binding transcriptional regulator [Candidatus Omnitrophica bacterium]|nr:YebC/PmpR family DNA-binding transcriptional regulator [Candidatus Omnitrophota bacterium]MDD5775480.1 YebC/PmpR family DNA-binding transcriptional regulator [Candidatus Omnitrophota bacterium]